MKGGWTKREKKEGEEEVAWMVEVAGGLKEIKSD